MIVQDDRRSGEMQWAESGRAWLPQVNGHQPSAAAVACGSLVEAEAHCTAVSPLTASHAARDMVPSAPSRRATIDKPWRSAKSTTLA